MAKQRGKSNALKHGAYSKAVLLWGEKAEDYQALRDGCIAEYYPDGRPKNIMSSAWCI